MIDLDAATPVPTPTTRPFWDAAREGRLSVQHCDSCSSYLFYPRLACVECGSRRLSWVETSGRATLLSYVIVHMPAPGFEEAAPYTLAIVRLAEGPTMMTNIVGVEPHPENLVLDMNLEVSFENRGGWVVPVFTPVVEAGR
ncbi:Zn-ribbon domain-containing OB-fold protein [Micromonospora sp. CPCC 206060]|uniref:Zn-ribbon domain-containing OB-fold protein n=1 Tax=Micromonospora sp. CPCC 206060 TaxID=3122406 RepID=UPI002FEF6CE0